MKKHPTAQRNCEQAEEWKNVRRRWNSKRNVEEGRANGCGMVG
jgi:hypothetical protein